MIKHIVCWTLKEFAEGCSKKENLQKVKLALENLKNKIPGILSLEVGENFDSAADAFDVSLIIEFRNKEDLKVYQEHPDHLNVIQFLRKVRDKRIVVDYEV
jgi:antibiotic biosynthesis monooxygenase (ABM) superfamily enzyme